MDEPHSNSEPTAQPVRGRPFVKGTSGNPGGRPMGSKNRIQAEFLRELSEDFASDGRTAIKRMREEDPSGYVRVVASLLPKDVTISARPFSEFSDDDLRAALELIQRAIAAGVMTSEATTIEGEVLAVPPVLTSGIEPCTARPA